MWQSFIVFADMAQIYLVESAFGRGRNAALLISTLGLIALPGAAGAQGVNCFDHMSRVPIAAAGPKARPAPHRAHMLR
ncbi:MAG TPA: hypothetical protein VF459_10980, partial [Caulobacteraceae bacterium]